MWENATLSYRRKKRLALATVALLVPTGVFCVIQYRSLTELESKNRLALAEQLRQDLIAARREVWRGINTVGRGVLVPASERFFTRFFTRQYLPWLQGHFAESRRLHPEIQELLLVSYPALQQGVTLAYLDGPAGQIHLDRTTWKQNREATLAVSAYTKAEVLAVRNQAATSRPNARRGFLCWQDDCPACTDRPEQAAYIFYSLLDPQTSRDVGFVGMKLDLKKIQDSYLPEAIAAFQKSAADRGESNLSLAVFDASQHEIYATRPHLTYEVRVPLGPVFSRWDVAAAYSGSTVAGLARNSLVRNLGLLVFAFSILLLGIFLILSAANREMKLAEAKSAFVSNVSHELKTPLSLIRLFGETLESGRVASAEKAHEYYRVIHNESVRLSQLINNILDFAQIESGRKRYNFERADVNELVASVVETYRQQIISEGFELGTHFEQGLPEIAVDRDAISQAVLNLLSNAVKYSTDTKKIMISVRREQGSILIQVADLGIGIPKSEHSKIFEKFYRVGSELVHNTKGSGLGLSLVKHITEAHQGQIRVESAPGKGSTFTLVLPIGQPERAPEKRKDLRYGLLQNLNR